MALVILNGTTASADISFATVSLKCAFSYMSFDFVREMFEQTTFCSSGWRSRIPGMKQLLGRLDGFATTGAAFSDPLAYMTTTVPVAIVATLDTSCTLTFSGFVNRSHVGLRAAGASEAGLDFESTGAVTSAWVTS